MTMNEPDSDINHYYAHTIIIINLGVLFATCHMNKHVKKY